MKDKERSFVAPLKSKDTHLHSDPIECYGCKEKYMLTVRDDPFEYVKKYCATCFAHIFSLPEYEIVLRSLNPMQRQMWEIPSDKLPKEIRDIIEDRKQTRP